MWPQLALLPPLVVYLVQRDKALFFIFLRENYTPSWAQVLRTHNKGKFLPSSLALCVFQRLTTAGIKMMKQRASRTFLMLYSQLFLATWSENLLTSNRREWTEVIWSQSPSHLACLPHPSYTGLWKDFVRGITKSHLLGRLSALLLTALF